MSKLILKIGLMVLIISFMAAKAQESSSSSDASNPPVNTIKPSGLDPESEAVVEVDRKTRAETEAQEKANTEEVKTKGGEAEVVEQKPQAKPKPVKKVFIPSEEISEDKPVPFPVDI